MSIIKEFGEAVQEYSAPLKIRRRAHNEGVKLLAGFECLHQYDEVFVHEVSELRNAHGHFTIMLLEKHLRIEVTNQYRVRKEKKVEEYEPVVFFHLATDMGKVFIKEETIGEKISDVFLKVDIDFKEYPKFSRNYFVTAENPRLVREHFPKALLETLSVAKEMNIEINGTFGLLRPQKNFSLPVLKKLLHIGYRLTF